MGIIEQRGRLSNSVVGSIYAMRVKEDQMIADLCDKTLSHEAN